MWRVVPISLLLLLMSASSALSRAWSYHYNPEPAEAPTQANATEATSVRPSQLSTAQLLKQEIVSELALSATKRTQVSTPMVEGASPRIFHLLLSFDRMNSPDDLRVLSLLSDYYLGAKSEALYDCISLRKGPVLKPFLRQTVLDQGADCVHEIGHGSLQNSATLEGRAVCDTKLQQTAHVNSLAAQIDRRDSCSDRQLAALIDNVGQNAAGLP